MKEFKFFIVGAIFLTLVGCSNYLDIVPDNVATIEHAFRMRSTAEKYLFTCYSFMPSLANKQTNPGIVGADEFWLSNDKTFWQTWRIAKGEQNLISPEVAVWDNLWIGISQCNIFLENILLVPDMEEQEKLQWAAEVKFLKAFYHFILLKYYGPIPIMGKNIPISASGEEVRVFQQPVDDVFDYIVDLIDEAKEDLPESLESREYGRVSLPAALGYKAKILVYAASPLFNGNSDYQGFNAKDGKPFFSSEYVADKWKKAAEACKEAIDVAHNAGYKLYEFEISPQTRNIPTELLVQMNNRGTVTEPGNDEIIWAHTRSTTRDLQEWVAPKSLSEQQRVNTIPNGSMGVPLKIASLFYTKNGVPINEDKEWDYNKRFQFRTGDDSHKYLIKEGAQTINFHFDRESRFYGSLGFDRGIWYGQGRYDGNDPYWLELRVGEFGGKQQIGWHSVTSYYAKKLINYTNSNPTSSTYTSVNYPWVLLRLGDLYLLYAEALNEAEGPSDLVYEYLDYIREKAGLGGVIESWSDYSTNPSKPLSKEGLREVIQRERAIDMAFEGERFWDLRRWKTAIEVLNKPITGWDVDQELIQNFYRERILFDQSFRLRDYFWPISENNLIINRNLVQNPGW